MKDYKIRLSLIMLILLFTWFVLRIQKVVAQNLLHQLVHVLNNNGVKAIIAYTAYNKEDNSLL